MTPVARHIRVHGHVQGVFFRDSARQRAEREGVQGWVRNDPDGSLEAWLEGDRGAVEAVETWIREGGPSRAVVADVDADDVEPAGYEGFEVRG